MKKRHFVCCWFLISLRLCKPVQFTFKFVDSSIPGSYSTTPSTLSSPSPPPFPRSSMLSSWLQQSLGHVCFLLPLIPLPFSSVMSSGKPYAWPHFSIFTSMCLGGFPCKCGRTSSQKFATKVSINSHPHTFSYISLNIL